MAQQQKIMCAQQHHQSNCVARVDTGSNDSSSYLVGTRFVKRSYVAHRYPEMVSAIWSLPAGYPQAPAHQRPRSLCVTASAPKTKIHAANHYEDSTKQHHIQEVQKCSVQGRPWQSTVEKDNKHPKVEAGELASTYSSSRS